ncbi:MAG: hypothetical protein KBE65_19050 [Phycisphaerae bacterium]|nr:hypothetical protein [Phycisphaerae bacterium]
MKRAIVCLTLALAAAGTVSASPMPLDGTWVILDQVMSEGDYFTGQWDWTSSSAVKFTITDLYVVSDQFEVYDSGSLVLTTPDMLDWSDLGVAGSKTAPPYETDPDAALASGYFSSGVITFAAGSHSIRIRDIHIPLQDSGEVYPDGTVAFKAMECPAVPVPGAVLLGTLGTGLVGWLRRRRSL